MTKTRGFEILSTWQGKDIHLPERKTEKSAGYDIECGEDIVHEGDEIMVKVTEIDDKGRINLSRKALLLDKKNK